MAEYSFSGNTYTDKTNLVDKIDASHVNNLQDEVEIIEGAISGGTPGEVFTAGATGKGEWAAPSGGGGGFQPVPVTGTWADSEAGKAQAWADIQAATGMTDINFAGNVSGFIFTIWEGLGDPDDYCKFSNYGSGWYFSMDFDSYPESGTVYIVGVDIDD